MPASLVELQQQFLKAFTEESPSDLAKLIDVQNSKLPVKKRIAIYQGSITECLANSLRDTYKTCEALVGEEFFNGLAYTFVKQTPSHSPDLGDYGEHFAAFIENFPPAQSLPYLADICRLCWAFHLAHRTHADKPFDAVGFSSLSEAEQAETTLHLARSAKLLHSDYPIKKIWSMCQPGETLEEINLGSGGDNLLIFRNNENKLVIDTLNQKEWTLANQLAKNISLKQLETQISFDFSELLPHFLTKGWLTSWSHQ